MIKLKTNNFPPGRYHAVTIWPVLFYKGELTIRDILHENVHERQYGICMIIGMVILGLKFIFFDSVPTWPFLIFPFILFYIIWGLGYWIKGYDHMKLEENAENAENAEIN